MLVIKLPKLLSLECFAWAMFLSCSFRASITEHLRNNVFVTRIKTNTVFETVREFELPQDIDQDILKD